MLDTDTQSLQPVSKPKFMWTREKIYAAMMSKLRRAINQHIEAEKTVAQLLYEADTIDVWFGTGGTTSKKLIKQLHAIETTFDITIYASYTLHDVASVAEWWLEKRGRMEPDNSNIKPANIITTTVHNGHGK